MHLYMNYVVFDMEEQQEDIPRWAYYICPSCAIYYGTKAIINAIRKRRAQHKMARIIEKLS